MANEAAGCGKLKDYWGNDAIDYGSEHEMAKKYADYLFVFVSDKPFGDGYVLSLFKNEEEDLAHKWEKDYRALMKNRGIAPVYGLGVNWGYNVLDERTAGFIGGVGV